ncbi:MAG: hypothetical protein AB6733_17920 [Clostridiaceae bacterium]
MIFLLIFVFITIAILEIPKLIKKKYRKELGVFMFFFSTSIIISLLIVLGVNVPSPVGWLENFVGKVLHLRYK